MTSPDDKDPVRSELEYAPPWVRDQVAREKRTREPAPREQMTRDQFRATLGKAPERQPSNWPQTIRKAGVSVTIGPGISARWSPNWFPRRRPGPRIFGR